MTGFDKPGVFSKSFKSAEQTITAGGPLTIAHALGVMPEFVQCRLICKTADAGYSVGDEVIINNGVSDDDGSGNLGLSTVPDATNINIRFGSNSWAVLLLNKGTGADSAVVVGSWKFVVRAWA